MHLKSENAMNDKVKKYVIIDTDMGTDDAWALLLLLKAEKYFQNIKVLGITTVHGNAEMGDVLHNIHRFLEVNSRRDIPVYEGATEALIPGPPYDFLFNGTNGMGDVQDEYHIENYDKLRHRTHHKGAVQAMYDLIMKYPHQVSIICVAPLTNLALALKTHPIIRNNIKEIYLMGGNASAVGNQSRCAEFNFFADPEAAYIVLNTAKCPITILPWEACLTDSLKISLDWRFNVIGTVACRYIKYLNLAEAVVYKSFDSWMPCDAYLAAIFLFPLTCVRKTRKFHATVELAGNYTRGQMILDHLRKNDDNVTVIDLLNEDGCKKVLRWAATILN